MLDKTQEEIEKEFHRCFRHDAMRDVHIRTGFNAKYLERWLNPNDELESPAYRLLKIQAALDEIDPVEGERHFQAFCRLRREAMIRGDRTLQGRIQQAVNRVESDLTEIKEIARKLPGVEWEQKKKK